jgi:hypothetical protein
MRSRLAGGRAVRLDAVPDRVRTRRETPEKLAVTARRGQGGEGRVGQAEQLAEPEPSTGGDYRRSGEAGRQLSHVNSGGNGGERMAVA